ncbi:hypothetical protein [Alloactinosynnema sp. L-07]|uniref:hypothetical protein n=1 Tax=Alloactinosynnema sp. L-07 TaxID=1653480 RepID=UPI00065F0B29|nr:hypothetical protein [Alloactinosynnema sp. L-07]CRK56957.1 hypothetical protein [Alloactinosynnema sp. L-07]
MISLLPDSDNPVTRDRHAAAAQYENATRTNHFHQILDATRLVTAAIPTATVIVVDIEHRWADPIGPTLQQVLDGSGYALWERYTDLSPSLAAWRTADGADWERAVKVVDEDLAAATRLDDLQELGWRELVQPGDFLVLRLPERDLLTGEWVYLPQFTDAANEYLCALRSCLLCSGAGLVARRDEAEGSDTCACVRTATW